MAGRSTGEPKLPWGRCACGTQAPFRDSTRCPKHSVVRQQELAAEWAEAAKTQAVIEVPPLPAEPDLEERLALADLVVAQLAA